MNKSKVYYTKDIIPESLVEMYKAVGKELTGKVAVKVHSGEKGNQNYLRPEFLKPIVEYVNGTIVECNTAYEGSRDTTEKHKKLLEELFIPFDSWSFRESIHNEEELAELLYVAYNREDSEVFGIDKAIDAGYNEIYIDSQSAIDKKIEKYAIKNAIGYDYFFDKWVWFDDIKDNIPYDFDNDDTFLKKNKVLECRNEDIIYLLHVDKYLNTGDVMPYEFARKRIIEILLNEYRINFNRELEQELYEEALHQGMVEKFYNSDNDSINVE